MADPLRFAEKFAEAIAESGLDSNVLAAPVADRLFERSETSEWYAFENIPAENDKDVLRDSMSGFRAMGGLLAELFNVRAVG
jgi:hypothetical protein